MKKFLEEVVKYFWIPVIMALVSYIFFQLHDVILGVTTLVALSAVYTLVRLYFTYKKWWLLIILMVVVFGSVGFYFLRTPDITLTINGQKVTGTTLEVDNGTIAISPAPLQGGKYSKGTLVTLHAEAAAGYDFVDWSGTTKDTVNPTTITMNTNKQVQAVFAARYALIINNQAVIGSYVSFTEGSITINPPPDGDGKYKNGTTVTLTVKTDPGYDFTSWAGTANDSANPTTVVMTGGNRNVTVNFEGRFALIISDQMVISSTLTFPYGSVTVSPGPGDDGMYAYGTKVTLTAKANTGYGWLYWSGTGADTTNPATVTINSEKHVAVTFEARYLILINNQALKSGTIDVNGGSVNADPAPGTDGRYAKDSVTTLTATPLPTWRFDHWSGDVTDKVTTVTVTLDGNKSLSATFIKTWLLTANLSPNNGGTVSPAGGTYDDGTDLTVTATPSMGYRFDRWGGAISGNVTISSLTMNADKTITAYFIRTHLLQVSVSPADSGNVSLSGGTFDEGTVLTISATPSSGYAFSYWTGDVSDNTSVTTNVTMDADKIIVANFITSP